MYLERIYLERKIKTGIVSLIEESLSHWKKAVFYYRVSTDKKPPYACLIAGCIEEKKIIVSGLQISLYSVATVRNKTTYSMDIVTYKKI